MLAVLIQHSPQFQSLLDERGALLWKMNLCFIVVAAVLAFPAFRMRRRSLAAALPIIGACASFFLASALFESWWSHLRQAAVNEADTQWVAYHDGGSMIVGLGMLLKALLCFAAISVAAFLGGWRRASAAALTDGHRL